MNRTCLRRSSGPIAVILASDCSKPEREKKPVNALAARQVEVGRIRQGAEVGDVVPQEGLLLSPDESPVLGAGGPVRVGQDDRSQRLQLDTLGDAADQRRRLDQPVQQLAVVRAVPGDDAARLTPEAGDGALRGGQRSPVPLPELVHGREAGDQLRLVGQRRLGDTVQGGDVRRAGQVAGRRPQLHLVGVHVVPPQEPAQGRLLAEAAQPAGVDRLALPVQHPAGQHPGAVHRRTSTPRWPAGQDRRLWTTGPSRRGGAAASRRPPGPGQRRRRRCSPGGSRFLPAGAPGTARPRPGGSSRRLRGDWRSPPARRTAPSRTLPGRRPRWRATAPARPARPATPPGGCTPPPGRDPWACR